MTTLKSKRRSHLTSELIERGLTIVQKQDDLISLSSGAGDQKPILVRIVDSQSRIKKVYHSNNKSPVKAIVVFQIPISTDTQPDFYILTFNNKTDGKTEYVIIGTTELFKRLKLFNHGHISGDLFLLVLWFMTNNRLYNATNISPEGEWYFIGGNMAEGTDFDFTYFLNNWDVLTDNNIPVSQLAEN